MKKLGIVGGVGWPSTIEYYRAICRMGAAVGQELPPGSPPRVPEMSIESLDLSKSYALRGDSTRGDASWAQYDLYFRNALERLEASGSGLAIIASSTPHNRLESITRGIGIPVLSLFDAVADECTRMNVHDLLILGTAPTMELPFFRHTLSAAGINAWAPQRREERDDVVSLISQLYANEGQNAMARIQRIVERSWPSGTASPAVCLGCTELPLAFPRFAHCTSFVIDGVTYLNSTMIHARAAFSRITAPRPNGDSHPHGMGINVSCLSQQQPTSAKKQSGHESFQCPAARGPSNP